MTDTKENQAPTEARSITIDELGLTASASAEDKSAGPREFLFAWFQLFRTAQIHAIENEAAQRPIRNFADVSRAIVSRDGAVSFQVKDGTIFVNSVKLTLTTDEYYEVAETIFEHLEEIGMGGFVIEGALDEAQVRELLTIMIYAPPEERKFPKLDAKLRASGLPFRINKSLGVRKKAADAVLERRAYSFLTYSKLVVLFRSLLAEESTSDAKRQFLVKKINRTMEGLVDICMEDDHTFLGVTSVKSADAYIPQHAANVAVLSIAVGEKLGLSKVQLADLGMAALFSDIGMKDVPKVVLDKGDVLDPSEKESLERHTVQSVKFLLKEKRYTKPLLVRIVVAFEHHRQVDGGGYPKLSHPPSLFARIVTIADTYDALTTERERRKAYLPDEALGVMLAESGKKFDPALLKIFVNTVGLYPVGTLVRLTSGELGVVTYSGGDEERVKRPIVALLGADGKPTHSVDLTEKDASGNYVREIVASEDATKYGLQTSGLLSVSPAP